MGIKYWMGLIPMNCQICNARIKDVFIDANTQMGWANVCKTCHRNYGRGLGTGLGQKYQKQPDGQWLKVEG